ncbi:MAG: amidohydrolase family protein [Acidobacteriales bacterium]|nr:amidohydrolase family protein [Terriglobales bacterium]
MTRRTFLAAVTAPLPPVCVVDTHTHFYDPSRPQGVPWPSKSETTLYRTVLPADFKKVAEPYGVKGTVVIEASAWVEDNQWILDLAAKDPFLLGVVGHLDAGKPEFARNMARFHRNPLFLGIRAGGAAVTEAWKSEAHIEDFRRLADAGLELDVLVAAALLPNVARLSDRVPNLRMVINHLPGATPPPASVLKELAARSALFVKVSAVLRRIDGRVVEDLAFYRDSLDALWEIFGENRLVYGSDWPVSARFSSYASVIGIVHRYFKGKSREACEKYFWRNSRAAYRWRDRGTRPTCTLYS